jgi:hypothetical protein
MARRKMKKPGLLRAFSASPRASRTTGGRHDRRSHPSRDLYHHRRNHRLAVALADRRAIPVPQPFHNVARVVIIVVGVLIVILAFRRVGRAETWPCVARRFRVNANQLGGVLFMGAGLILVCMGALLGVIYGIGEVEMALLLVGAIAALLGLALFVGTL